MSYSIFEVRLARQSTFPRSRLFVGHLAFALFALACSSVDPANRSAADSFGGASPANEARGGGVSSGGRSGATGASGSSSTSGSSALGSSSGGSRPVGRPPASDVDASPSANPSTDGAPSLDGGPTCDTAILLWPDCDGDSFAAPGAKQELVCAGFTTPPSPSAGCLPGLGSWTGTDPASRADCDDHDSNLSPGNTDSCTNPDGLDNDCDGIVDAHWYFPDCDGDGFAAASASSQKILGCDPPAPCGGTGYYTLTAPKGNAIDCDDADANVHPGAASHETPDPRWGFDYDCDGQTTPDIALAGVSVFATCVNVPRKCVGDTGWVTSTAPGCGASGVLSECRCADGFCSICQRVTSQPVQACR